MLHSKRHSITSRKVSPPQPTCMTPDQKASYLADLRNNRPARPTGGRPLPSRPLPQPSEAQDLPPRAESALSFRQSTEQDVGLRKISKEQKLAHRASLPASNSHVSLGSQKGRPLVPTPGYAGSSSNSQRRVSPPQAALLEAKYRESTARVKEREEAHKLREALHRIDQEDDERRIHDAAKSEAADLVWRHRHPQEAEVEKTAAYRNPDLTSTKYGELGQARNGVGSSSTDSKTNSRSASAESNASIDNKRARLPWLRKRSKVDTTLPDTQVQTKPHPPESLVQRGVRKISGKRQTSSGSSKGIFRNPEDEIFEEVAEMPVISETAPAAQLPLQSRERNSLPRGSRPIPEKSFTDPLPEKPRSNRVEIWKNEPSQSRNAGYTATRALPQTPAKQIQEEPEIQDADDTRYNEEGVEIRGDDIRAATSMRKSDRSPNLPTPTAVSDRPGRPIVSFDPKWRPGSDSPRNSQDRERPQTQDRNNGAKSYPVKPSPPVPEITIMEDSQSPALQKEQASQPTRPGVPSIVTPVIPVINVSDEQPLPPKSQNVPTIALLGEDIVSSSVPSISVEVEQPKSRPLPAIRAPGNAARPLPSHTQSSPSRLPPSRPTQSEMASRVPWLSRDPTATSTSSVACTACGLPISGRIVTASGSSARSQKARFHPECFTCHHCSTGLEAVAFYPEPEASRLERLQAALPHLSPDDPQIQSLAQSNEDMHFFCHLDYHELFSPRCHNCKTPIEGAVILALGRHYHADHFFCAECGDPFSSESPFVEHNDYPYCVSCHTKRTSARCRSCKQPILNEMTIEALGGKWHDACFVCCDCSGDFGDEGRFFVREIEVPLTEKQQRKGMPQQYEQRAACQACEEKRVKNVNLFL